MFNRFSIALLRVVWVIVLIAGSRIQPASAQCVEDCPGETCHDGCWDADEFCGYDARLVTGRAEMNHDCVVDLYDFVLFYRQYPPNPSPGPCASADLNGNGVIDLEDLSALSQSLPPFVPWGEPVPGCVPSPPVLPTLQQGALALSFDGVDPMNIVSTATLTGLGPHSVYIVASGWTDAAAFAFTMESNPDIVLSTAVPLTPGTRLNTFFRPGAYACFKDLGQGVFATGPVLVARIDFFMLTNTDPQNPVATTIAFADPNAAHQNLGWIREGTGGLSSASASTTLGGFYKFASVTNAAVNGATPPVATGVGREHTPESYRIVSLVPNPFNPSTTVNFTLPADMSVAASIWSVDGARVRVLAHDQIFSAGDNVITWDGRDDHGAPVASGVYFVRLETSLGVLTQRAVLLK